MRMPKCGEQGEGCISYHLMNEEPFRKKGEKLGEYLKFRAQGLGRTKEGACEREGLCLVVGEGKTDWIRLVPCKS